MNERYINVEISSIWSSENKLHLWQKTELAVMQARVSLGQMKSEDFSAIEDCLTKQSISISWWKARDGEVKHDLNAFLDERLRHLSKELQPFFHKRMTSYDTEEPAFAAMIRDSIVYIEEAFGRLESTLKLLAKKYRFTVMNGRTHGQEAEMQSAGKRFLTWLQSLRVSAASLQVSKKNLEYSKLSGAVGNYGGIDPELEKKALEILGFKPFYGATQIMPRELYAPIAQSLAQIVATLDKIATDVRLGARSGAPIWQEPFGKKQKGSSAMPHKKNTISTEQIEGMSRMANGYLSMIQQNMKTWEERAIEQSCVERVAWPDLFHVTLHSLNTMNRVLSGLQVYPDNMLREIIDSRGCYAAGEVKEYLREAGSQYGLSSEDAYRIVQLAAFNAFTPDSRVRAVRNSVPSCLSEAGRSIEAMRNIVLEESIPRNISSIIYGGDLEASSELDASEELVASWNASLKKIFTEERHEEWFRLFTPEYLLQNETLLYKEILGE